MAPRSRPPNGAVTCQSVPTRPSAVRRAAAWLRRLGACAASAATAASWLTARCAASPNAANAWATGPICGVSRPFIEISATGIYLFTRRPRRGLSWHGQRDEIGGLRYRRLGMDHPVGSAGLQQQRNQTGPAGLVRGAEAAAGVAVKIFIEQHIVAEANILLLDPRIPEHRAATLLVAQKDPAQTLRQLVGHLSEMHQPARPDRAFDLEIVAVITVEPMQRLDNQEIHRHPDRTAPIGIAAEHARVCLPRDVADLEPVAGTIQH